MRANPCKRRQRLAAASVVLLAIASFSPVPRVVAQLAGEWVPLASMRTARSDPAAATGKDGRVYVFGGFNDSLVPPEPGSRQGFLNSGEVYTPAANTWSSIAPMPTPRNLAAAATAPDGRIYVMGGFTGHLTCPPTSDPFAGNCNVLGTVERYNPATNTWDTVTPMPTRRVGLAAATGPDGRIYAIGGGSPEIGGLPIVEAYDPTSNSWATVAPMSTPRLYHGAATGADGRIYAIGGRTGPFATNGVNTVEAFDTARGLWLPVAPMKTPRSRLAAAAGPDGRIYAIGGIDILDNELNEVQALPVGPAATWQDVAPMGIGRTRHVAAGGAVRVYAIGGASNNVYLNSVEAFFPNPPSLSVNDVTVTEGNMGTVDANFTVTLSRPTNHQVTVNFATADGTATTAGNDYTANSGTVTFPALSTTPQSVTVKVNGDTVFEPDETFFVNLSMPMNATLGDAQGRGTITNDDPATVFPTTSTLASSANPSTFGRPVTFTDTVCGGSSPPTGSVTFSGTFTDGPTRSLSPGGGPNCSRAALTIASLQVGSHPITATYGGDASHTGSSATLNPPQVVRCTDNRTSVSGNLVVPSGTATCVSGPVTGNVTVLSGGALYMTNTTVGGSISAEGARALTVCGSTVNGLVRIANSSGYVLLGNGNGGCTPNTFRRSVTLVTNHGGFRVAGNAITESLGAVNNTVTSGALNPTGGPATHVIRANSVGGSLNCSGNVPAPTNEGSPNTATGGKTGQCSGL